MIRIISPTEKRQNITPFEGLYNEIISWLGLG
jgi:hypothetical protein